MNRRAADGFTLIELLVVLTIVSISLAYAVPKLVGREGGELKDSARRLLYTMRRLSDEAQFRKEKRLLSIDLDKGEYWDSAGRKRSELPRHVVIERVIVGGTEIHRGVVSITCFASGLRDEALITLASTGRRAYTVVIPALGERFELREE